MNLYEKIVNREEKISVVGLGYVGMPLAVAFAQKADVIGFDNNSKKIDEYNKGHDAAGRRINGGMGKYVAENTVKSVIKADKLVKGVKVVVMGIAFKEDCPDVRNSKVIDIVKEIKEYDIDVNVYDQYGIKLSNLQEINDMNAVIFAVLHSEFRNLTMQQIESLFGNCSETVDEVTTDVVEKTKKTYTN